MQFTLQAHGTQHSLILKNFLCILCVQEFCLHICASVPCAQNASIGQKRASDLPELELDSY